MIKNAPTFTLRSLKSVMRYKKLCNIGKAKFFKVNKKNGRFVIEKKPLFTR